MNTDPQCGQLKTVAEFLSSGAPLAPIDNSITPYPLHMVTGTPRPPLPIARASIWDRAAAPVMALRLLFARDKGSIAR